MAFRAIAAALLAVLLGPGTTAQPAAQRTTIVLIGGNTPHGPGVHEAQNAIRLIEQYLTTSPNLRGKNVTVRAYPDGWPSDPRALDDAATIVWYFDGLEHHPLRDEAKRGQLARLMAKGVGLVTFHQASTLLPADAAIGLERWLGGVRLGMVDRTVETVALTPGDHIVSYGVKPFAYRDEFYPSITYLPAGVTPVLSGALHLEAAPERPPTRRTVAWAFDRPGGGRAFGFTGLHYLGSLDQPELRKLLLNAILWTAGLDVPRAGVGTDPAGSASSGVDKLTFHHDAQRSGWNPNERVLTPAAVASGRFGPVWQSPQLDGFGETPARLFATPLYVRGVEIGTGPYQGKRLAVVYAVTATGYAYAINATAAAGGLAPGTILWRTQLAPKPCEEGMSGNLSTPVIDRAADRMYVTSCDDDQKWRVHALDIRSGRELPGWPIAIDAVAINRPGVNRNGANRYTDDRTIIQRGALNLSVDKARLYIAIGPDSTGWLVAVDTRRGEIVSAFSSTATANEDQGGMWASAGPSVDEQGRIHIATGSKFLARARKGVAGIFPDSKHNWAHSVLQFRDARDRGLVLTGTYTPFNYCQAGSADIDLGSSGTIAIDLPTGSAGTPRLLALGGKQGNLYLLDRDRLPGSLEKRQPCATDPDTDGSLLAPEPQPQFGMRGPVNLFGPYSDYVSMLDQAKSRSTPAYFRDAAGQTHILATGSAKTGKDFSVSAPPSLARVAVIAEPGKPAFLRVAALEETQVFENSGSPVISSAGGIGAIVWVFDTNAPRTASLYGEGAPQPVLYAFDAISLKLLWKNAPGVLFTSGKYNEATIIDGMALVGTDRIQAFGLRASARVPARATPAAKPRTAISRGIAPRPPDAKPRAAAARATTASAAPASKPAAANHAIVTGRRIYQARCAACHNARQPGTPTRADLAKLPSAQIVSALLTGVMKPMAAGMSRSDAEAVARFLKEGR